MSYKIPMEYDNDTLRECTECECNFEPQSDLQVMCEDCMEALPLCFDEEVA